MKNWQFIVLLSIMIIWFVYFWYRINTMQNYIKNIDENVATMDWRIVDIVPSIKNTELNSYWIDTVHELLGSAIEMLARTND